MAVDSSNRFPEIKTHVKQVASYISFLFNTFYFNTWISSFDRWLILLTFTICTRRACRVDLYFQIGPRHKLTSETVKGHSPHMAQHGWIYHCRAARCMRQARAVPAYKTHPQLLIFAAVKKSAPYTRVFTVVKKKTPCTNTLFPMDKKGIKEPVHSSDGGHYAKACPESRGIVTMFVWRTQSVMFMCI